MRLLRPMIIAAVLVLVLVLSGCAKKAELAPVAAPEPTAPEAPAEAPEAAASEVPEEVSVEEGAAAPTPRPTVSGNVEKVLEMTARKADYLWERKEGVSAFSDVNCELREDDSITLSFTLANEDGKTALGEQNPLAGTPGAQISINGQRLKGNRVAGACGEDAPMLEEGERITCVVDSTLRRNVIDKSQKVQSLEFKTADYTTLYRFKCAE